MSNDQKRGWNGQNVPPVAFNHLLERVSHQFAPNHGSTHYQSGFMPSTNPPWPSQHHNQQIPVTYSQHNQPQHVLSMNSTVSSAPLNQQVNMNSARSFSVSQEPFPEMGGNRTPLLRSSSDLGMRLAHYAAQRNNFADCQLDGILDHQVEPLDGSLYFSESSQLPQGHPLHVTNSTQNYQHVPTTNTEIIGNHILYGSYIVSESDSSQQLEPANNFATKLSNFTASLGTWFSPLPLDQVRSNYSLNSDEPVNSLSNSNRISSSENDSNLHTSDARIISTSSSSLEDVGRLTTITTRPKPSYSDVLTKAPSQESKTNVNGITAPGSRNINYHPSSCHQRTRGESSARSTGKAKSRNSTAGRSNSPTANINNVNINMSGKQNSKFEQSSSKVGLDEFYLPENVTTINSSYSSYLVNLNNNSKSCNFENLDKSKKRPSLTSEDSSPVHQVKKECKNESKKSTSEKFEESPASSDAEKSPCEKLNNSLSTQQKQTPRRTTFINNNLASTSGNNSSKANNTETYRKVSSKEDSKLQYDAVSNKNVTATAGNSAVLNVSGNAVHNRATPSGPRSNRSLNSANKGERIKEPQNKKNFNKKKKESSPYIHSDLLTTGWMMCLLWIDMAARAGLWLLRLVVDVIQMSSRLLIHFSLKVFVSGKLQWRDIKLILFGYWTKLPSFSRKKGDTKKLGRGDRKAASGLDNNIPLPTTGEEAMKRLLACRGKDPYSILGVTHECTDDDIKKYYKRQAFLVHPDKNKQPGAEEAFKILAHAFEIIGEPEKREQYDTKVAEEAHLEGAWGELSSLLNRLKEKLEEAANTIRCTNCNKRHKRVKLPRPIYAARHCAECQIKHAAREGDIWAESWLLGLRWKYFACMEGAIYDISEWAACQRENLKHLQANTHSVQYRIVSGKKNSGGKNSAPECPTDPELEDFFNNLCRDKFGQDFVPGSTQSGAQPPNSTDARKRRGKKKK